MGGNYIMELKIKTVILWVLIYIGVMLFYTFCNVAIWRKIAPKYSNYLNILFIIISVITYLIMLCKKTGFKLNILENVTPLNIVLAIGCSILFYFLLDKGLDKIFESLYPTSEESYKEMIESLTKSPVTAFLQTCIIAPIIEEILMRGFVLGGLKNEYGIIIALIISSVLFAILHFNMVQTLSAFVIGLILGLLFVKTDSILCCIIAHCGYNIISYLVMILPHIKK